MRYSRLISLGLLCSPIAISALENPSNKEIGLDSNKSGISIAEVSRKANTRYVFVFSLLDVTLSISLLISFKPLIFCPSDYSVRPPGLWAG